MKPTSEFQIQFLQNLQRLLSEGSFVATYKYALLLALADISVENGNDSGDPLPIKTSQIAEKFISYYWRQTILDVCINSYSLGSIRHTIPFVDGLSSGSRHITHYRKLSSPLGAGTRF
jgi:hypothetical protein